jgi:hypothetical protein
MAKKYLGLHVKCHYVTTATMKLMVSVVSVHNASDINLHDNPSNRNRDIGEQVLWPSCKVTLFIHLSQRNSSLQ